MKAINCVILLLTSISAENSVAQVPLFNPAVYYSDFGAPEIRGNEAFISQLGQANSADVDQKQPVANDGNFTQVDQIGSLNEVVTTQTGGANRARISQDGSANVADLVQQGSNNSLDLTQIGIGNRFDMTQTGDSVIVSGQLGNSNTISAPMVGQGVSGVLNEVGNNNSIVVAPGYSGSPINVTVTNGMSVTVQ